MPVTQQKVIRFPIKNASLMVKVADRLVQDKQFTVTLPKDIDNMEAFEIIQRVRKQYGSIIAKVEAELKLIDPRIKLMGKLQ